MARRLIRLDLRKHNRAIISAAVPCGATFTFDAAPPRASNGQQEWAAPSSPALITYIRLRKTYVSIQSRLSGAPLLGFAAVTAQPTALSS
jgi:hypothetical protein